MKIVDEIEEYTNAIRNLAAHKSFAVFDNKGIEHASAVISSIMDNSNEIVRMYATDMNGDISNKGCYKSSIEKLLSKNVKLKIILDDTSKIKKGGDNIISVLYNRYGADKELLDIRTANESFHSEMRSISSDKKSLYHFTVGDDSMVRVETEAKSHKAVCSFNFPVYATILSKVFDKNFNDLPPYSNE